MPIARLSTHVLDTTVGRHPGDTVTADGVSLAGEGVTNDDGRIFQLNARQVALARTGGIG